VDLPRQASREAPGDIAMSKGFVSDPAVNAMLRDYDLPENRDILQGFSDPVTMLRLSS